MTRRTWAWSAVVLLLGGVMLAEASSWLPFISDDALISLRYAERASQGLGLTWTEGERTEGYTNLLWVLLNVPAFWLPIDPLLWTRALGLVGMALAVACAAAPVGAAGPSWARTLAALMLATSVPLGVWAIGGLEQTFVGGLLALGLVLVLAALSGEAPPRAWLWAGFPFAAVTLTRADGAVLVATAAAGILFASLRVGRALLGRRLTAFLLAPVLAWLTQLLARRAYYGEWVPNTALAKVSFNLVRVRLGVSWVTEGLLASWVLVGAALVASVLLLRSSPTRRRWLVLATVALGWCAYVALVGGDIFPAWRQLVPALVVLGLIVAEGATALTERAWPRGAVIGGVLGWAVVLALHVHTQRAEPENRRARTERWEWDGMPLGRLLRAGFAPLQPAPVIAVDAAGALPFWSALPAIDMLGLNDRWLARHPPPHFGTGPIGHELGNGAYVLGRGPDLIAFCSPAGSRTPCFHGGRELVADPRFARDYRLARFRAGTVTGEYWLRVSGGPLAPVSTPSRMVLPAWLLASDAPAVVVADEAGALRVDAGLAAIADVLLPAGSWRVADSTLTVAWRCGGLSATGGRVFSSDGAQKVTIQMRSPHPRWLSSITLERVVDQAGGRCPQVGEPVRAAAESLSWPQAEHSAWNGPGTLVFGAAGARLDFARTVDGPLELSTDNNDTYRVRFLAEEQEVGALVLPPVNNGGGLTVRRIEPPAPFTSMVFEATGDGSFSIGHLTLR